MTAPAATAPGRRWVRRVTRVLSGLGVTGLAAAVLAAGVAQAGGPDGLLQPAPAPDPVPLPEVTVPPGTTRLVCPGPVRLPTSDEAGTDLGYDAAFDPAPVDTRTEVVAATLPGASGVAPARLEDLTGSTTGLPDLGRRGPEAASVALPDGTLVLSADPVDGIAPVVAAGATSHTPAGDLRGLAGASCARPAAEAWLVGGSTVLGTSARLVVQNPGRTPAAVHLEAWGAGGPIEIAATGDMLVPAESERALLIEGIAAEQPRLVLRLTATGGLVTAYLQDSVLRGFTPAGVDLIADSAPPATVQVLPGVAVEASDVDAADPAVVRVLAAGDTDGVAAVRLLGPDGEVPVPGAGRLELPAGVVVDVPLAGVPAGHYVAVVEADVPVVAGALVTRTAVRDGAPAERAWVPAARGGTDSVLTLPTAEDVTAALVITAVDPAGTGPAGPVPALLEGLDATGGAVLSREVTVHPGRAQVVTDLDPSATAVRLTATEGAGALAWAAVLTAPAEDGEHVSVLSAVPIPPGGEQVVVRVVHGSG